MSSSRRFPPLNALRVFEVVARTGNLTAAAAELFVTQSAVSRQIGALESYLGIELFRRERYGVSLTRAGRAYAQDIVPLFAGIAAATGKLLQDSREGVLRVRTYTTFTGKWLIPRLPEFQARHPGIEVRISNAVPDVDFDRDDVDLAIQFGSGSWRGCRAELLFWDEIEPVCSPRYLAACGQAPRRDEALLRRLLVSQYRRSDWDDWLQQTGLAGEVEQAERMRFSSSVLTWQAALDGLGAAIGQIALLMPELESGALVRPFGRPVRRSLGHFLVYPDAVQPSGKAALFRRWLLEAAEQTRVRQDAFRAG